MFGGIAVWRNLLCVAYSEARSKVWLIDLDDSRVLSHWEFGGDEGGFASAGGVAFGPHGEVFVADSANHCVRWFTAFGKTVGSLGEPIRRGPMARERDRRGVLDTPRSVAAHEDRIYIGCGERKLVCGVQCYDLDGESRVPLRSMGESDSRFGAPRGLHADALGLLVADTLNGKIQRFDANGRFIAQFATAPDGETVARPVAVVRLLEGRVLVLDAGDRPGLQCFAPDGEPSALGSEWRSHLDHAVALATDPKGRVYISDRDGERVQRFAPDLAFESVTVDVASLARDDLLDF